MALEDLWPLLFFPLFLALSVKSPYHVDSVAYVRAIHEFPRCTYATRCAAGWSLVPLGLVFGDASLWITYSLLASLSLLLYFLLAKEFTDIAWIPVLILAFTPSFFVSTTVAKEDPAAFFFLLLALWLSGKERYRMISPLPMALAILSKEIALLFLPLYALSLLRFSPRLLVLPVISFLLALLLQPRLISTILSYSGNPYMGMFVPFAPWMLHGIGLWTYGLSLPVFLLQFIAPLTRRKEGVLLFLYSMAVAFYLVNNSVVHYRHFFWVLFPVLPFSVDFLGSLNRKLPLVLLLLPPLLLWTYFPTVYLRSIYNPQQGFFSGLKDLNGVLLGMDSCPLATYYSGLPCIHHKPDLDERGAREFLESLEPGTYYLLPDFWAYDSRGGVKRVFGALNGRAVYENIYEDYHSVYIAPTVQEFVDTLRSKLPCDYGVKLVGREGPLDIYEVSGCGERAFFYGFMGRVFYKMKRVPVIEIRVYQPPS